ncbi:hypothetical protein QBC47DRAFT_456769 [Echria macrotheca]|uniref:Uncharacterized protein n=1 Tax=Echria macrotheca TaxID=438768 RepID=A0AAJ0BMN6_9PEZI|nr:hypothetical protein QBC47DRAFT_456769 [Echria macrotheca]
MSSKTVKFRRDSPSGGSYLDHQRSDSGVGSFSDSESRTAYGDRPFGGSDFDAPDLYALQDALHNEVSAKQRWMAKATELDDLLSRAHKEIKEAEARMRALEDHVDELEEEKTKLAKANKEMTEENARLKEELKESSSSSTKRKSKSSPVMSGALNTDRDEEKKPRRSASKRHSVRDSDRVEREKERERLHREIEKEMEREKEREMDRLRRRFDKTGDESDAKSSNTSNKSHRSRRESYVEPLGASAPRPQAQVPPSPSRQYSYSSAPYPPQYQPAGAPRAQAVHPQVVVSYSDTSRDEEDGLYHPHPLPNKQRAGRERRG